MRENGTDRDVALDMLDALTTIASTVATINSNLFAPVIFTQPTNQTVAVGGSCTFSISAGNIKTYQWQFMTLTDVNPQWNNSALSGANTNSITINPVEERHYNNKFRCVLTGLDNSVIYSNEVAVIAPEPEG